MTSRLEVVQLVTTLSLGGAQLTVLDTSRSMPDDVRVTVVAGPDVIGEGDLRAEFAAAGISVVQIGSLHRALRPWSDVIALIELARYLRRTRPHLLHTHSSKAGVLGRLAGWLTGVPVVHTVHGWSFAAVGRPAVRRAMVLLERVLARACRRLVVVSTVDMETGLTEGIGHREQYRIVRSGIDLPQGEVGADRAWARAEMGVAEECFVVGTVARLAPQKELSTLVDGFNRSEPAAQGSHLVVIGDGVERTSLESMVATLGLRDRVTFTGARPDAARLITAFDVFVLTSRWEGLPRTLIEAMAREVPVVATSVGGVAEVVEDGVTGLVVPVGDAEAVASALRRIAADRKFGSTIAVQARRQLRPFSVEGMRTDAVEVWRNVAEQADRRRRAA